MATILIADDEEEVRRIFQESLLPEGYEVITVSTTEQATEYLRQGMIDLVFADLRMPEEEDGLALLSEAVKINPYLPVIMITAFASIPTAVEAMRKGAYDYVPKPFHLEEIKILIRKALENRWLQQENEYLRLQLRTRQPVLDSIIGKSPKIEQVRSFLLRIAPTNSTVLITGETGAGKTLVARTIHAYSDRRDGPFIIVDCSSFPEGILESELFGHKKGSFTGAVSDKAGLLELAEGGTFFIDEVSEIPLSIQPKLLRAIEDKESRPVGGLTSKKVNVRIIAATNHNLEDYVRQGKFREDLYYRLNVINIEIPPLRERKEDIPILASYFLNKYRTETKKPIRGINEEALEILINYSWPGNIRELENVIQRAVVLQMGDFINPEALPETLGRISSPSGTILEKFPEEDKLVKVSQEIIPDHSYSEISAHDSFSPLKKTVGVAEKKLILETLHRTGGNRKAAAKLLGISLRSLRYRMQKHGITRYPPN